jgi:YfiR/HmsC-like
LRAIALAVVTLYATAAHDARGEEVGVPERLQAELVAKMATYDRGFLARAGDRAHVVIIDKPDDADSARAATHLESAFRALPDVGGLPHDEAVVAWSGASALPGLVSARHAAIVYFTPGFASDVGEIRAALDGVDVLSVSAVAEYVPRGIVLGFDLVSGKPKLLVNLGQARKQHVAFMAEVLKLARVYE